MDKEIIELTEEEIAEMEHVLDQYVMTPRAVCKCEKCNYEIETGVGWDGGNDFDCGQEPDCGECGEELEPEYEDKLNMISVKVGFMEGCKDAGINISLEAAVLWLDDFCDNSVKDDDFIEFRDEVGKKYEITY